MILWWYVVYQSVLVLTWNCVFWRSCGVTFHTMCFTLLRGTVPLTGNTTPSTATGLLLFPGQESSPLLLQVKKPTSWYKPQCGSARLKPLARFYTVYSPTAGHKSFLEKKEQIESYYKMNTNNSSSQPQTLPQIYNDHRESEERRRSLKLEGFIRLSTSSCARALSLFSFECIWSSDCQPLGGLRDQQA
ncbi:hypothetical protein Taro_013002 [Colocasia esculenta]|uniref:Uncharacterized protein n=1 Tax=Colocasia esculenta TaxID=4460 RepID=A0A843UAE6_COLES|nr:hypothetical protein [Colocasia esculenta]